MREINIFLPAKSDGETWFEHSKNTYHVGRVIYNLLEEEISKFFTEKEFLWCCFFHDIGKLLKKEVKDPHTPNTEQAFKILKNSNIYQQLIKQFCLDDFSNDNKLIQLIKEHHNNKIEGSEWITIADIISSSDFGEINEFQSTSLPPYIKFLISDIPKLKEFRLIKIELPIPAYLERVIFGQLYLKKVLREAVDKICDNKNTFYLFDTKQGCKILTKINKEEIAKKTKESFKRHLVELFENFNIIQLMGGQPQGFVRLRQYIFSERIDIVEKNLKKLMLIEFLNNIRKTVKSKDFPSVTELLEYPITKIYEVVEEYSGFTPKDFEKIYEYDSLFLGFHNEVKTALLDPPDKVLEKFKKGKNYLKPITRIIENEKNLKKPKIVMELILEKIGIDLVNKKYQQQLYEPIAKYIIRRNNFNNPNHEKYPSLDVTPLLNYIIFDNQIPIENFANHENDVCSSCGTFKQFMDAGQIVIPFSKQQWRERIGKSKIPQTLCPLCYFSMLMCTYLIGTDKVGNNVRPKESMFLVLQGLNIKEDIEKFINQDSFQQQFIKKFNKLSKSKIEIKESIIYIPNITDFEIIVLSLTSTRNEFFNYPSLQKYSMYDFMLDLIENIENIYSISYNQQPILKDKFIVNTPTGQIDLKGIDKDINLFRYLWDFSPDIKSLILYFKMFSRNAAFALSNLVKETQLKGRRKVYLSNENFKEGLKMVAEDRNYILIKNLWKVVGLLNQLPTGFGKYEVVRPIKFFKGTPESLDKTLNFLLKDTKVNKEKQEEALKLFRELRVELKKLNKKEQKELAEYAKKTTFLFSKLEWMNKKGGE
ncbi:hypothetical protein DRN58_02545 [Thermococci archaeon]|nr:MAG: hypothetical protein DRN58_02545 [Thermococci archaeon]